MIIKIIFTIFIGFSGGLISWSRFCCVFNGLGIIPRLTQLTKTMKMIQLYEWGVVLGAVVGTLVMFQDIHLHISPYVLILFGLARRKFCWNVGSSLNRSIECVSYFSKKNRS